VDFSVLNDIFQRPTLNPLGMPPSTTEIQHHITKLANNKSPGESGIPAEALKALPPDGIEYVRTLLQDFWEGRRIYIAKIRLFHPETRLNTKYQEKAVFWIFFPPRRRERT
jgi:hypothetical protein